MFIPQFRRCTIHSPRLKALILSSALAVLLVAGNSTLPMASASGWMNLPATREIVLEQCRELTSRPGTNWHLLQTPDETGEIVLTHVVSHGWLQKVVHFGWMKPGETVVRINGGMGNYQVPFTKVTSLLAKVDPAVIGAWTFEDWEQWFQKNDLSRKSALAAKG